MLDNNFEIEVINRYNGITGYVLDDGNERIVRSFEPKEKKMITMGELRKLSFKAGGPAILKGYLVVKNEEAIKELLGGVEPEYFYTEDEVIALLTSGSLDQLMDALDFAPIGVVEMIKDFAVAMEINDMSKRQAIIAATGFNVNAAIENNKAERLAELAEGKEEKKSAAPARRTAPITEGAEAKPTTDPGRRAATPASPYSIKK